MLEYIRWIIIPYINRKREEFVDETPAVVIMDNFKGQVTTAVNELLEENNIHVCLLPANTTDCLQPMDLSVNKPAKDFLRQKFQEWYAHQVLQQLHGRDIDSVELQPINLSLPLLKELGAKWLVEMFEYIASNLQIIVNGFVKSGIPSALDGEDEQPQDPGSENGATSDDSEEYDSDSEQ